MKDKIDFKDFGHAVDPVKFFKENPDAIVHISIKSLLQLEDKRHREGREEFAKELLQIPYQLMNSKYSFYPHLAFELIDRIEKEINKVKH